MVFDSLTSAQIAAGQPVTQDTTGKVKGNEDDHETRILALENTVLNPDPITFVIKGELWLASFPLTGQVYQRVWANLTLTAGRIFVVGAGTAGTIQVDVKYKRGAGAWTTIFATKPSAVYTDGDLYTSTNGVLSVTSILAGDFLRLDVDTAQTGNLEFHVELPFGVT